MTKGHKIVSIELPLAEIQRIEEECQGPPYLGNRSAYLRDHIAHRHEKQVTAAPKEQQLIDHFTQQRQQDQQTAREQLAHQALDYQQQLDQLQEDHQAEADQFERELSAQRAAFEQSSADSGQALLMLQAEYDQLQQRYIKVMTESQLNEFTQAYQIKQLEADRERLTQEGQAWQAKYEQKNREADELSQQLRKAKQPTAIIDGLTKGVGNMVRENTFLGEAVAERGLYGLWVGKGKSQEAGPPSEATQLGQALIHDFKPDRLKHLLNLIRYYRDQPAVLERQLSESGFVAYQQQASSASQRKQD